MQSPQGDIDSAALGCVHVPQTTEGHKKKKPHTLRGHLKSMQSDNEQYYKHICPPMCLHCAPKLVSCVMTFT